MMIIKPGSVEVKSSPPVGPNEGLAGGELNIQIKGSVHFTDGSNQAGTAQEVPTDITNSTGTKD